NLVALGIGTQLLTAVGDDEVGDWLLGETTLAGVDITAAIKRVGMATGRYIAVLEPGGNLGVGLADMAAIESLGRQDIEAASSLINNATAIFADVNLVPDTLAAIFAIAAATKTPVAVDLVSPAKLTRLPADLSPIDLVVGNRLEAATLLGAGGATLDLASAIVGRGAGAAVISDGDGPLGWCEKNVTGTARGTLIPRHAEVVDVTGAGDALHAGIIAARLGGASLQMASKAGLVAASRVVSSSAHALKISATEEISTP
ncbi:MAG: PfkB family carbohydrate kinase, partial [Hyphomicrobiales bacterium]